ncbi:MAG: DUF58 domain-containing protein [Flavobacteriales bacterium]|nr:DUF58 domain-containing protein [Flavobacteriales bacterium]
MESSELLNKIRKIEIRARGMSKQLFSGHYSSAFKGRGMTFSEVREYNFGDETRTIDWNVTARFNEPYVKTFEEEREQTVMFIIDVSASESFGSINQTKREYITEVCAVLAFSAISNNDKVGVIFCSDQVEKFIPPRKGKNHILRIIRDLLEFEPENKGTDLNAGLIQLTHGVKRRCTAFLVSDFITEGYFNTLKMAKSKHDIIAIKCFDELEKSLPKIGLAKMFNPETGQENWVNTNSKSTQQHYTNWWNALSAEFDDYCKKTGIDQVLLNTNENYTTPLMKVFKRREGK